MQSSKLAKEIQNGKYDRVDNDGTKVIVLPASIKEELISSLFELYKLRKSISRPRKFIKSSNKF